ncbi:hypothetical protein AA103581_0732 [Gluconobacter wancherniae NBRC 103581]|nr:hypothetical protein AA103581_0732 [Gluconobacter wancherniae NBRC 103581]
MLWLVVMTAATVMITGTIIGMDTDVVPLAHMQAWAAEYALQTAITADNNKNSRSRIGAS